jgi:hypothetical protein
MRDNRDEWGNWLHEVAAQRRAASKAAKKASKPVRLVGHTPNLGRRFRRAYRRGDKKLAARILEVMVKRAA